MMKKLLCLFMLGLVAVTSLPTTTYAGITREDTLAHHSSCLPDNVDRWENIAFDGAAVMYDTKSVEKENKFNPFKDAIITMWVFRCSEKNFIKVRHFPKVYQVRINIDQRTYIDLSDDDHEVKSIRPGTAEEAIYEKARDIY